MPRHVDELENEDPFQVKPDTNEYTALSFLVSNREFGFTPAEIAARTAVPEASASKTMTRLFEKGVVERSQGTYYVDPGLAEDLERRLDSIDAAIRFFEQAPEDAYAESGWESRIPSIDRDEGRTDSEPEDDVAGTQSEANAVVEELADDGGR